MIFIDTNFIKKNSLPTYRNNNKNTTTTTTTVINRNTEIVGGGVCTASGGGVQQLKQKQQQQQQALKTYSLSSNQQPLKNHLTSFNSNFDNSIKPQQYQQQQNQQQQPQSQQQLFNLEDEELNAPIAKLDLDEWFEFINSDETSHPSVKDDAELSTKPTPTPTPTQTPTSRKQQNTNLVDSIDLCSSLEDLVKTFDQNVKECLSNYKDIDIGQLAPVQVRSQEDIMHDSQIWYTLTGNFGNLLPIDYWSKSLVRKYHTNSLNINKSSNNNNNNNNKTKTNVNLSTASSTVNYRVKGVKSFKGYSDDLNDYNLNYNEFEEDNDDANDTNDDDDYRVDDDDDDDDDNSINNDDEYEDEDDDLKRASNLSKDYSENDDSEFSFKTNSAAAANRLFDRRNDKNMINDNDFNNEINTSDYLDFDEDDDELREQLDMHSMIITKSSVYNENGELDEPLITAEQVLNEIETMMTMQDEYYDEMTPDSGCYSLFGLNNATNSLILTNSSGLSSSSAADLPIDMNGSYLNYINTFALMQNSIQPYQQHHHHHLNHQHQPQQLQQHRPLQQQQQAQTQTNSFNYNKNLILAEQLDRNFESSGSCCLEQEFKFNTLITFIPCKNELTKLNTYELNELIDQIEAQIKELSDTLVQELALRDELEFEKETRNTFISLLMSIQDKKRQLNSDTFHHYNRHSSSISSNCNTSSSSLSGNSSSSSNSKRKTRRSLVNSNLDLNNSTHLTTIIPYNSEIEYTVQHLQILNKLLKAINEDSHQVPELLTNYILKVVCPT